MKFPVIIDQSGPLPISTTIEWPSSGPVVVAVSGSAWSKTAGTMMSVRVSKDGTVIGTLTHYSNPTSTHLAFPTAFITVMGGQGKCVIALNADEATVTDVNDHFTVALLF